MSLKTVPLLIGSVGLIILVAAFKVDNNALYIFMLCLSCFFFYISVRAWPRGTRLQQAFAEFCNEPAKCAECDWRGRVKQIRVFYDEDGMHQMCPKCQGYAVEYPKGKQVRYNELLRAEKMKKDSKK